MKSLLNLALVIVILILASSMQQVSTNKAAATAEQVDGIYVFYRCRPVAEFESLGSVKPGITLSGAPDEQVNGLVKNARKQFPAADAILIGDPGMKRADAIKFK